MSMSVQHASGVNSVGKVGQTEPVGDDMMAKIKMLLEELLKMLAQDARKPGDEQQAGDSSGGGCKGAGSASKGGSAPPAGGAGGAAGGGSAPGGAGKGGASGGGAAGQATGSQSTPNDLPGDKKGTIDRAEQDINDKYGSFMQPGEKQAQFQVADPGAGNAGITQIAHDGQADQIKLGGDLKGSDLYHVAGHEKAHASMSKEFEAAFNGKSGEMSAIEGGAEMIANSATPEKGFNNEYYTKGYVGNAEKARDMVGDDTFSKAFFGGDAASIKQVQQAFNSMGAA
jgi:hypothetical protein